MVGNGARFGAGTIGRLMDPVVDVIILNWNNAAEARLRAPSNLRESDCDGGTGRYFFGNGEDIVEIFS
jgi:hypothetical protein